MKRSFVTFISIPLMIAIDCANAQTNMIQHKKWRMAKQVISTTEKKHNPTQQERLKDFTLMDYLSFDNDKKLSITYYGETAAYEYKLEDSILTFWPEKEPQKINEYRLMTSTKDSLVLKRTEIWGADSALKITAIFYLTAIKNK